MGWLLLAIGSIILLFGFVVLFGAPYLPTLSPQVGVALRLADLKKGQHLLELGCGDGKVLLAAAKQGILVTGYEINPILALISWARTRKYRGRVKVVWANFWRVTLPGADAIFVFLLPKYMDKLDKKIIQEYSGKKIKLVSFAFKIESKQASIEEHGVLLYDY